MQKLANVINQLSILPVFITAAYAIIISRQLSKELRTFSWFLYLSGFIQLTSAILWYKGINNLPLLHIYVAMGFLLLAWFYTKVLSGFINPSIIWVAAFAFLLFTTFNSIFLQTIFKFNSYALTAEAVLIVILSLFTYTVLLNDLVKEVRLSSIRSLLWINSGLFIYYASNLLIFYFGEIITHTLSRDLNRYAWVLHSFFSVVMYCCFFVGLWKRPRI